VTTIHFASSTTHAKCNDGYVTCAKSVITPRWSLSRWSARSWLLSAGRGPRPSSRCHGAAAVTVDCRLTTLNALSDLAIVGGHLKNLLSLLVTRRFQTTPYTRTDRRHFCRVVAVHLTAANNNAYCNAVVRLSVGLSVTSMDSLKNEAIYDHYNGHYYTASQETSHF